MNQLQIMLSGSYKLLKQSIAIGCSILAICLLNASTLSVAAQSAEDEQTVQVFMGESSSTSHQIQQGKVISIPVTVHSQEEGAKISVISADVRYDPTQLQVTECAKNPRQSMDHVQCNFTTNEPGVVSMNGISIEGVSGVLTLVILEFHALGSTGAQTNLDLKIKEATDPQGNKFIFTDTDQSSSVEITDAGVTECTPTSTTICSVYSVYLPTIIN